jgi:hypothetical protein
MASEKKVRAEKEQLEEIIEAVVEQTQEAEYTSHRQQLIESLPPPERIKNLEKVLLAAFEKVIIYEQVAFIRFGDLDVFELARIFVAFPMVVKATCSCVNVAQRAIKRDLKFDFDTYADRIDEVRAAALAGYLKPFLPDRIALPALMELDRYWRTDKEMRANKGRWEDAVREAVSTASGVAFRKRKFRAGSEEFEIDAAYPSGGDAIEVAVDVKRIESPRDIHKRADEIINKASKFKAVNPSGKFFAVVYYPFPNEHIKSRAVLRAHSLTDCSSLRRRRPPSPQLPTCLPGCST